MTKKPEKQNDIVAALPSAENIVGGQHPAAAGTTNSGTATFAPQLSELIRDTRSAYPIDIGISAAMPQQCSLKIEAAKAADPFFSGRKHYPELDGLRGVAIALVLLTHYSMVIPDTTPFVAAIHAVFERGWAGVDLFFVLSGFLITGILYDAKGQTNYFRNFYARRFLRTFPLYYGFLAVMLAVLVLLRLHSPGSFSPGRYRAVLWGAQPWLWTYTMNIYSGLGLGPHSRPLIFGQFWSLSVEEQFYLAWPLMVYLLPWRKLVFILGGIIVAAPVIRLLLTAAGAAPTVTYMLTPCRMDSLAAGASLALLMRSPIWLDRLRGVVPLLAGASGAVLAASLIVVPFFGGWLGTKSHAGQLAGWLGGAWCKDVLFSVIAVFFSCVMALVLAPYPTQEWPRRLQSLLRYGWLRSLGKYSYGIYVFHLPIIVSSMLILAKYRFFSATRRDFSAALLFIAANFTLTYFVSVASYHLYEKHLLKLKKYFPEKTVGTGQ